MSSGPSKEQGLNGFDEGSFFAGEAEGSAGTVAVISVGAGLPGARLAVSDVSAAWDHPAVSGSLAVCSSDEDALTLAWSAGRNAIFSAGVESCSIDGLWWGTSRPPMAEGPLHAFLAAALGLEGSVSGLLAGGSPHAGMDALLAAWDAVASGWSRRALVIASDAVIPGPGTALELSTGAGAVAYLLERHSRRSPAVLEARFTYGRPILDSYRGDGQHATSGPYDGRLFREEMLLALMAELGSAVGDKALRATWSLPDPDGKLLHSVSKAFGAREVCSAGVHNQVGNTGTAAPFLGALSAMCEPGTVGMVAYGGGRATAVTMELASAIPGGSQAMEVLRGGSSPPRRVSYTSTLRARGELAAFLEPIPMGVPPGSAAFARGNSEMLGLTGRRCHACGGVAVPPSIHPVCPFCGASGGSQIRLSLSGKVLTFVVNQTMPPPFEAPLPIVVVDLDDGARAMFQGLPQDAPSYKVGDRVVLELRRYALERGIPVYGFKARRSSLVDEQPGSGPIEDLRLSSVDEPVSQAASQRVRDEGETSADSDERLASQGRML